MGCPRRSSILVSLPAIVLATANCSDELPPRAFDLLVSSRNTNAVRRYHGGTGEYIDDFVTPGAGGLSRPQEVLLTSDGTLLVTGRDTSAVLKFAASTGELLGEFTTGQALSEPTKTSFGEDGMLYVSQWGPSARRVARFDAETGAFVDSVAEGLRQGMDHAWDAQGQLVVASFEDGRIYTYAADGTRSTLVNAPLEGPVNLWFGENGNLFVIDWTLGDVIEFSPTGELIRVVLDTEANLEGYAMGPDGRLYVGNWSGHLVLSMELDGSDRRTFTMGDRPLNPNSLLFIPAPD